MEQFNVLLAKLEDLLEETTLNYEEIADRIIEAFDRLNDMITNGQVQANNEWVKALKRKLLDIQDDFYGTGNGI